MDKKRSRRGRRKPGALRYDTYRMNNRETLCCLCRGVIKIGMVSYLFYDSMIAFLCMLPYLYVYMKKEDGRLQKQRLEILRREFKEGIQALQAALDTGYSVENAFAEACRDLKLLYPQGSYITTEFLRIVQGVRMSKTVEEMLADFGNRSGLEEIQNFAEIFRIARKSGGDLLLIIRSTVQTIRDKLEVQGEIAAMLAGKRFEQKIMNIIPFGILLYVKLTSGKMLEIMYGNALGAVIMSVCLIVYLVSMFLAERIVCVEV